MNSNEKSNGTSIPEKFLSPYDHIDTEDRIYDMWQKSGLFNPDICIEKGFTDKDAEIFSIVLPPPNVTGTLHTGHASMLAIEDIMVRFARMRGLRTLWIPGTDHAAIATQSKVEKELAKEKIRKQDLGREEFLKRVEKFAQDSHDTIISQCIKMGASLDWSREAYTLDETRHEAVFSAFKKMYDDGLIYRKERIVNWDPKGQTTISDDEIVREERKSKMYTFKYSNDFPFPIATTRPETKLGDTAVAVHPDDARYKEYVGKEYSFEFAGETVTVKIIADEEVDPEFGVGALGVTPAHSQTDWEIAERHNLPMKQVINEYAKMTVGMEGVKDTKVEAAREAVVEWLRKENLLINEEEVVQSVATAERTGGIIEPLPKMQWWVDVNKKNETGKSLKDLMLDVVKESEINIMPERYERVYTNWIENLRDWNISRQIWYGHRVPAWHKDGKIEVSKTSPGDGWVQDEDTLDTWFSSGLWTFSTLLDKEVYDIDLKKWLANSKDSIYHPTTVLETGYDIIFFWVARMVLMTKYLIGEIPFKNVYLHGLVRDKQGRKMSKSLGNTLDPVDVIKDYGADALRMGLIVGIGPGGDNNLSEEKIKAYKKFGNKIWNATRFVLENTSDFDTSITPKLDPSHQEYIDEWQKLLEEITKEMTEYKLYLVGEKLYHFFWHRFADIIIEECKKDMNDSAKYTLLYLLKEQIKALHPFMPFVTEEIWSLLGHDSPLMVEKWSIKA
ncbi:MAG: valine--tRNA ligase [Candidatus Nomurabacteria bacterium]|nr:MAG: valine--tRNA ligase [Candidatus Nomurabacteria bacterium]